MSEVKAGRQERADAKRSRAKVLGAAIELLGRRPDASMDEVAAAAGVARQTVYAHYPSRQVLITAIVERLTAATVEALAGVDAEAGTSTEALESWVRRSWQLIHQYPVMLTPAMTAVDGDDYERHQPILDSLLRILRRGRRTGEFDTARPPHWQASALIALGHAAGAEAAAGRMSVAAAGDAFRDAALRITAGDPPPHPSAGTG